MSTAVACPSEDDIACFIEGSAAPAVMERLQLHLDNCELCRLLVAGTLRAEDSTQRSSSRRGGPRTFPVGEVLNKRYRIERFIARGGMGEVYEARDLQLGETVALKTIVCTDLDDSRLLARVRAEVLLARRITHPNVCRILEYGLLERSYRDEIETVPYFTMEFLRGETLKQYLKRHGRLSEAEVVPIALQIVDGLMAVHAAGIVHRDLKSDNVCVVPSESKKLRAILMDFGLARPTASQDSHLGSVSGSPAGTPAYMAPEQTLGGQPAPAWDIYAVGVVLFELVTGTLPFVAENAVAMAVARVQSDAPTLSSLRSGVNPAFEAIVTRCLQRDPKRRFTSAEEVRQALLQVRVTAHTPRRWKPTLTVAMLGAVGMLAGWSLIPPRKTIRPTSTSPSPAVQLTRLPQVKATPDQPPVLVQVGPSASSGLTLPLPEIPHPAQASTQHPRPWSPNEGVAAAPPRSRGPQVTSAAVDNVARSFKPVARNVAQPSSSAELTPTGIASTSPADDVAIPAFAVAPKRALDPRAP